MSRHKGDTVNFKLIVAVFSLLITSACTTNSLSPSLYQKNEISKVEAFNVILSQPVKQIEIAHERSQNPSNGVILQVIAESVDERADKEISEVIEEFNSDSPSVEIEKHIVQSLCSTLGKKCINTESDSSVKLTPMFSGYRFDQLANLKYVPTFILKVEATTQGKSIFVHTIGAGNLFRIKNVRKIGIREDLGYKKPENILNNKEEAISNLKLVIDDVSEAVYRYLKEGT